MAWQKKVLIHKFGIFSLDYNVLQVHYYKLYMVANVLYIYILTIHTVKSLITIETFRIIIGLIN